VRIAFDITCIKNPMGGYERYARELLRALATIPGDHRMVAFAERSYGEHVVCESPLIERRAPRTLPVFIAKVLFQDQTYWPLLMRHARVDVVHSPVFAGMIRAPRPYVLTLHDMIPLKDPTTLTPSAAWYWQAVLPRAVARADIIITVSGFSQREICEHFGLTPERVVTIPQGVDPRFRPVRDPETLQAVRARYRLPASYLLFVGIASPRKNLDRLVRAFAKLSPSARGEAELILVGPPGWSNENLTRLLAGPAGRGVRRLGTVPDDDLPALYSLARGVVNLSSYEGFGLPALEALACGTPLACANASAFPEVVGDCAILVDPRDEEAVSDALVTLLRGGTEVAARSELGKRRAAEFTWDRTAQATLEVYRRVAG